jgi:hypothetical protein
VRTAGFVVVFQRRGELARGERLHARFLVLSQCQISEHNRHWQPVSVVWTSERRQDV